MNKHLLDPPPYNQRVSALFILLAAGLILTLLFSIALYEGKFSVWHQAFSDLGKTTNQQGQSNVKSMLSYSAGMLMESVVMFKIGREYQKNPSLRHSSWKHALALSACVGFVISIYPNDLNHTVHSLGAGLVIAASYFFILTFHFELRQAMTGLMFTLDLIVLHLSVLPYAYGFFADLPTKQGLQKICLTGIIFSLERKVDFTAANAYLRKIFAVDRFLPL